MNKMWQKVRVFMIKKFKFKVLKRTLKYLIEISKRIVVLRLISVMFLGFVSGLTIYGSKILFDLFNSKVELNIFLKTIIIYIFIQIIDIITSECSSYLIDISHIKLQNHIDEILFNKYQSLQLSDYENPDTYDLINKAQMDGTASVIGTFDSLCQIITQVFSISSIFAVIFSVQTWGLLIVLIIPIVSSIFSYKLEKDTYKFKVQRIPLLRKKAYFNSLVTDASSFKEIKAFELGEYFLNKYRNILNYLKNKESDISKKRFKYNIITQLIDVLVTVSVIIVSMLRAINGLFSFGMIVAYINSLTTIKDNMNTLLNSINNIIIQSVYAEMYFNFLDLNIDRSPKERKFIEKNINNISIMNLYFKYQSNYDNTLKDINLNIKMGERVVLIGENGSGKTTLMKILSGLYKDYDGKVLINGTDLKQLDEFDYRRYLSFFFQDYIMYELTLRENIALSDINSMNDDDKIENIIKNLNLTSKTSEFKNGLDTQLGFWLEGKQLSIGQWQRLAVSRACFRKADLYLLDEPTSSLDVKAEYNVLKTFLDNDINNIKILVSHKISSIVFFDPRIIVMKDGRIIADGKHNNLYTSCDHYKELYDNSMKIQVRKN